MYTAPCFVLPKLSRPFVRIHMLFSRPFFFIIHMEDLSYNIETSACCGAACVACWKCSALRHSTTQPHHRQNKKMGRIREEAMGGGNREHQKPRRWTNAASAPPSFHLLPSHIYLSIYTVYSFAYKHFYFIFFFYLLKKKKKREKSLRKPWHSVVICAAATLYCFK